MAEILLPPHLPIARVSLVTDDRTAADESPVTGHIQTSEIYGSRRQRIRLDFQNLDSRSGNLQAYRAFVARLQGRKNRVWIRDPSYVQRGSFSASELLANNDFASGTTGWTAENATLSATDRRLRIASAGADANVGATQAVSTTNYIPYVMRAMQKRIAGSGEASMGFWDGAVFVGESGDGMLQAGLVPSASQSVYLGLRGREFAGDSVDVEFSSLSRCIFVDAGANSLLRSDALDHAAWTKTRCSIIADVTTAPDGTSSADTIVEDSTASSTHFVRAASAVAVPSGSQDLNIRGAFKYSSQRTHIALSLIDGALTGVAIAYFNIQAGTVGTVGTSGAAVFSSPRAIISPLGDGWYYCSLVAKKESGVTSYHAESYLASADNTVSYTGNGTWGAFAWRICASQSSLHSRLVQTTSAVVAGSSTGTRLYVKGLPASTQGLLREGDQVQIGRFLRFVTSSLDSNAAGLGVLSVNEPIYPAPSDNDPVIVHAPMGRFMLASESGYDIEPGIFGNASIELVEA